MDLLLPGHRVDEMTDGIEHDVAVAQRFGELLRALDDRLRLFWVKPDATSFSDPGRWHIAWVHPHNPELNTYFVVKGENGEYAPPTDSDIEALQRIDTYSGRRSYQQIANARTRKQEAKDKAFEEKRREFRETLTDRLAHLYDPRVAITGAMKDKLVELKAPASPRDIVIPGA